MRCFPETFLLPSVHLSSSVYLSILFFFFFSVLCNPPPPTTTTIPSLIKSLVSSSTSHQSLPHLHTSICWMWDHTHSLSVSLQRCIADPVHYSCSFGVYSSAKLVKPQLHSVGTRLCELNKLKSLFSPIVGSSMVSVMLLAEKHMTIKNIKNMILHLHYCITVWVYMHFSWL